jgi:TetR/AcrR family transcriptional repressor of nem operon
MGRPAKLPLEEVMQRATRLFWEQGCDAVSTRDLERALDLRSPAIYRRFRSKDELLARCLEFYVDTVITTRIRRHLELAADPMQGLHDFFTSTLEGAPPLRGCLMANTATHAEWRVPEVRDAVHRGWRLLRSAFEKQVLRAQQAGQLPTELDPVATSQALMMSLLGALTLVRAGITELRPGIDATLRGLGWLPPSKANDDRHPREASEAKPPVAARSRPRNKHSRPTPR